MHSNILCCCLIVGPLLAGISCAEPRSFDDVFTTPRVFEDGIGKGDPIPGACDDSQVERLRDMYAEMVTVTRRVTEILIDEGPKSPRIPQPLADVLKNMMGVPWLAQLSERESETWLLRQKKFQYVRRHFRLLEKFFAGKLNRPDQAPDRIQLFCKSTVMKFIGLDDRLPDRVGRGGGDVFRSSRHFPPKSNMWYFYVPSAGPRGGFYKLSKMSGLESPWENNVFDYCHRENAHSFTVEVRTIGGRSQRGKTTKTIMILCPQVFLKPGPEGSDEMVRTYVDHLDFGKQQVGRPLIEMRTTWQPWLREMLYYAALLIAPRLRGVAKPDVRAEVCWYEVTMDDFGFSFRYDFFEQHGVIQSPNQCNSLAEYDRSLDLNEHHGFEQVNLTKCKAIRSAENYSWVAMAIVLEDQGFEKQIWASGVCQDRTQGSVRLDQRPDGNNPGADRGGSRGFAGGGNGNRASGQPSKSCKRPTSHREEGSCRHKALKDDSGQHSRQDSSQEKQNKYRFVPHHPSEQAPGSHQHKWRLPEWNPSIPHHPSEQREAPGSHQYNVGRLPEWGWDDPYTPVRPPPKNTRKTGKTDKQRDSFVPYNPLGRDKDCCQFRADGDIPPTKI